LIESVETEPMVIVYKATNLVNNHFYLGYSARGLAQREEKHRADEARANMRVAQAKNRKPVQCVNDGRVFESSREAEIFYGLCQAAVTRVVTGRIKSARGLVFIRWEPK